MIAGQQAIAIVRVEASDRREAVAALGNLKPLEASKYIGLFVVVSANGDVVDLAGENSLVAVQVKGDKGAHLTDEDYVRAIVDSDEVDVFVEGNPYLVYLNMNLTAATINQIDEGLERLSKMGDDSTLVAPGLGLGRLGAFRVFGQFNGPNASAL